MAAIGVMRRRQSRRQRQSAAYLGMAARRQANAEMKHRLQPANRRGGEMASARK